VEYCGTWLASELLRSEKLAGKPAPTPEPAVTCFFIQSLGRPWQEPSLAAMQAARLMSVCGIGPVTATALAAADRLRWASLEIFGVHTGFSEGQPGRPCGSSVVR
jgi:hypothetical protein